MRWIVSPSESTSSECAPHCYVVCPVDIPCGVNCAPPFYVICNPVD